MRAALGAHALPDASDAHSFYDSKDQRRLTLDTARVAILLAPEKGGLSGTGLTQYVRATDWGRSLWIGE